MATAAQLTANQANAQHSTGPKTDAGKASSSQNATTHGLTSKYTIVLPGQEEDFAKLSESLTGAFQPEGAYEELLFKQILHAAWNMERCRKAEFDLQAAVAGPGTDILTVQANYAQLKLIALYHSRAERSMAQAARELRRVQTEAFYRTESGLPADLPPLMETQSVVKQLVAERLRRSQANLTEIRAALEAPPPQAPPQPPHAAAAPAPRPAPVVVAKPPSPAAAIVNALTRFAAEPRTRSSSPPA
ncbi:MAG: hypothetical protein JNK87_40865 [Bryobacterales bacterium]|nr:hypothetical protein [Bryobacterales bacterium]